MKKHGLSRHPLHRAWRAMRERCRNEKSKRYVDYGGKGIAVCKEWDVSFMSFYDWAISEWKPGLALSRKDIHGDYNKENCRFADLSVNNRNKRLLIKSNTSGYRGVSWHRSHKRWRAQIDIEGKRVELGHFDSALEAAIRWDEVASKLDDERPLNFKE